MYEVRLPEAVERKVFGELMAKASKVAKVRGIRACSPVIDGESVRGGVTSSDTWRILKAGRRYIDIFAGVLAGEGYLAMIRELPNPWDEKRNRRRGRITPEQLQEE